MSSIVNTGGKLLCVRDLLGGHSRSDGCAYRPKGEKEEWLKRDPLLLMRNHLVEERILSDGECDRLAAEVEEEIEEAVRFAQSSPDPKPEATLEDVYA